MARLVVNFLNAGAVGTSYWSLIDQYYGRNEPYAAMQQLGMWRYMRVAYRQDPDPNVYDRLTSDYQPRPQYYAYSLLTRFVRKGSEVYPLDLGNEFAAGAAIRTADGRWTYVIANATGQDLSFDLKNSLRGGMQPCKVYTYDERAAARRRRTNRPVAATREPRRHILCRRQGPQRHRAHAALTPGHPENKNPARLSLRGF